MRAKHQQEENKEKKQQNVARDTRTAQSRKADAEPLRQFEYTWHMWMGSRGFLGPGSVGDISAMNDLGRKGWEMVAMYDRVVLFKRELPPPPREDRTGSVAGIVDGEARTDPPVGSLNTDAAGDDGDEVIAERAALHDVVLMSAGGNKLQVIKALRLAVRGLGLNEAREIVDSTPSVVARGLDFDAAEGLATDLEASGASVDLI